MNLGGTLVNTVVRLVVLFATLALVYLFIIKPILDTTERVSSGFNGNVQNALDDVNRAFDVTTQPNGQIGQARKFRIKQTITRVDGKKQKRLLRCIQNSDQDILRMQRCAMQFSE